jgi:hypothetical protein
MTLIKLYLGVLQPSNDENSLRTVFAMNFKCKK